jgi:hypothetical protein
LREDIICYGKTEEGEGEVGAFHILLELDLDVDLSVETLI